MTEEKMVTAPEQTARKKKEAMFVITLRRLSKNKMAMAGLVVITVMLLIAIFGNVLAPYDYIEPDLFNTFATPSKDHLFGTDELGRDILSRLIIGSRYSLQIGLESVTISAVIGIALGAICGYFGGQVDNVIMRLMDVFQALPSLVMAIAITLLIEKPGAWLLGKFFRLFEKRKTA